MKTRLHTADVLTFTLTGAEPQCALTLAALHDIRLFHIRALPSGVQAQIAGVDWPRLQALLGDDRWTVKLLRCRRAGRIFGAAGLTSRPATGCSLGVFGDTTAQPFCLDDRF